MVLETEEESGSVDLIPLLDTAKEFIGKPDTCFCLDSGCLDYDALWMTSSLRGVAMVDATIDVGLTSYHSGEVGGVVPETFRIFRRLLSRLDNEETGKVDSAFDTETPEWKLKEAEELASQLGTSLYDKFPLHDGVKAMEQDNLAELYLNGTWRCNLSVTGAKGLPDIEKAGNVVRPFTSLRLSMRLAPNMSAEKAKQIMVEKLTTDVPYNAKVTISNSLCGNGWCMKDLQGYLRETIEEAGQDFFGKPAASYGEGGSIPFLNELEGVYPETQIVALGVGGPNSNAHAPNEMIVLDYAKRLTCALAHILVGCANPPLKTK